MPYDFYNASRLVSDSPKQSMLDSYQQLINERFVNATNVFTIEEETSVGSLSYVSTVVRLDTIIGENGIRLSDDFRKVIFKDMGHARGLGFKFRFDSSTWLTINYDLYGKATASTIIRKCRNVLKFIDKSTGALLQEPCVVENYSTKSPKPYATNSITIPEGYVIVDVQGNDTTYKIEVNQRFILNGKAFKVWNILNSLNNPTYDHDAPLLYIVLGTDEINTAVDDTVNNIANATEVSYSLNIKQNNFQQSVGFVGKLDASVFLNGEFVVTPVVWSSSSPLIGTVDSNGNISLLTLGQVVYTCSINGNPLVFDTVTVDVVAIPVVVSQTILLPEDTTILQGQTINYSVYKYISGNPNSDTFTIVASNAPTANYALTILTGNTFSIKNNLRYKSGYLIITATNDTTLEVTTINLTLGGVF